MPAKSTFTPLPSTGCCQAGSLHDHLKSLTEKYAMEIPAGAHLAATLDDAANAKSAILPGWIFCSDQGKNLAGDQGIPLLTWQSHRRYVELRNLIQTNTVEHVCLWRSRFLAPKDRWTIPQAIYRELAIAQWAIGSPVVSVYAAIHQGIAANITAKLANDVALGIEISLTLPKGSPIMDRHEAIARRGVASDQVVDSVVRPSSVYLLSQEEQAAYIDTDSELFGLDEEQVSIVRQAFSLIRQPKTLEAHRTEHAAICQAVAATIESNRLIKRLDVAQGGAR